MDSTWLARYLPLQAGAALRSARAVPFSPSSTLDLPCPARSAGLAPVLHRLLPSPARRYSPDGTARRITLLHLFQIDPLDRVNSADEPQIAATPTIVIAVPSGSMTYDRAEEIVK